jgi:hypothetical protein
VVRCIWEAVGYRCGRTKGPQLLAPLIRLVIDFLASAQDFGPLITPDIKAKLMTISPRTRFRGGDHRPPARSGPESPGTSGNPATSRRARKSLRGKQLRRVLQLPEPDRCRLRLG